MFRAGKLIELCGEILGRALLELGDANVAERVLERLHLHRLRFDDGAFEIEVKGLHGTLAGDFKVNFGFWLAPHALDGIFEREVGTGFAVDLDDDVACTHASSCGRRVVDRRDDAHARWVLGDLKAESAEGAVSCFIHVLEAVRVKEARVRVKTAHHAFHGELEQLLIGDVVNVKVLDGIEDAGELPDFLQWKGRGLLDGESLQADADENACAKACSEEKCGAKILHDPNRLKGDEEGIVAYFPNHGVGLTGLPRCRISK